MNRQGFAPIAIIIIVFTLLIAGGGILYYASRKATPTSASPTTPPSPQAAPQPTTASTTSTQPDTSNWQTYRNEKHGFEVRYPKFTPKDYIVEDKYGSGTISFESWDVTGGGFYSNFLLSVHENPASSLSLRDWFEQNADYKGLLLKSGVYTARALPDGGSAIVINNNVPLPNEYLDNAGPVTASFFVGPPSMKYIVSFSIDGQANDLGLYGYGANSGYDKLASQILSTFQFIPSSGAIQPRADVEQYIASTYPQSARKRAALSQVASALEKMATDSQNPVLVKNDVQQLDNANDCVDYAFMASDADVVGGRAAYDAKNSLRARVLNTADLIRAYFQADSAIGATVTFSTPYAQKASHCLVDPSTLPN